jgi:hypothetical protein
VAYVLMALYTRFELKQNLSYIGFHGIVINDI